MIDQELHQLIFHEALKMKSSENSFNIKVWASTLTSVFLEQLGKDSFQLESPDAPLQLQSAHRITLKIFSVHVNSLQ